ncbi:MAG: PilN domain-containing protein [Methylophilaceae bacterium]
MRHLNLDYRQDHRLVRYSAYLMLFISLVLSIVLLMHYSHVSHENENLTALIEKIEGKALPNRTTSSGAELNLEQQKELIVFSNQIVNKLNLPWADLFDSLGKAHSDEVALLGIEPNIKKGVVKLNGEARNFKAMFDFMRDLNKKSGMTKVYLIEHKVNEQDPDRPIHFTLEASWTNKS